MEEKEIVGTKEINDSWLFNFYSPVLILIIGVAGFLILLLTAELTGTRFYSVAGVHYLKADEYNDTFLSNIASVLILILVCIVYIELIGRELNIIRIINAVLISRLPFLFFALFNIDQYIQNLIIINLSKFKHELYDFLAADLLVLGVYLVIGVAAIVYSIWLLQKGLRPLTGRPGKREIILFGFGLLMAELGSRIMIQFL